MDCYQKAKGTLNERLQIDRAELERTKQESIRNIATEIIKLRDAIYLSGKLEQDNFIQASVSEARKLRNFDLETRKKNACFLRPNVAYRNGEHHAPSMRWVKIVKLPKNDKQNKPIYKLCEIKAGKHLTYGVPNYASKPSWAKQSIKNTEISLRQLREDNELVTAILRLIYSLSKNINAYHQKDKDILEYLGLDESPDDLAKRIPVLTRDEFKKMVQQLHKKTEVPEEVIEEIWTEEFGVNPNDMPDD